MDKVHENMLSTILRKRVESLGYASLRKFHSDRAELDCSYELLRQVVYTGRVPRSETLLRILHAMRFTHPQVRKIMEYHYRGYVSPEGTATPPSPDSGADNPPGTRDAAGGDAADPAPPAAEGEGDRAEPLSLHDPAEIASRLSRSLLNIPRQGNDDFWEIVLHLAAVAERKVQDLSRRREDQPLLFEKEPEAIYHFLVRRAKIPPFLSRGENLALEFAAGSDYRDRFRGALLGGAIGEALGKPAQGLSPRDVRELYGRIEASGPSRTPRAPAGAPGAALPPSSLPIARSLLRHGRIDPEEIAGLVAAAAGRSRGGAEAEFAANLSDRRYPWYESGVNLPDSAPAGRVVPLSLLRAGDFRRLKLEAGILASITHPNAAAIAGAVVQAVAVSRLLHTPSGSLDVLGFARGISPAITGIEPDRAARSRQVRPPSTLLRRLGTELAALLLRRAEIDDVQESLGNGTAVQEGLPFAWACFLRSPESFADVVLAAVNLGNDAEGTAAMAGSLCGAYVGASAIPERYLSAAPMRRELERTADELLALARSNAGTVS